MKSNSCNSIYAVMYVKFNVQISFPLFRSTMKTLRSALVHSMVLNITVQRRQTPGFKQFSISDPLKSSVGYPSLIASLACVLELSEADAEMLVNYYKWNSILANVKSPLTGKYYDLHNVQQN